MSSTADFISHYVDAKLQSKGVQVYIKTNLGPTLKVYDARNQNAGPGLLKAGITIKDADGRTLMQTEQPPTDIFLSIAAGVSVFGVAYLLYRGFTA